MSLLVVDNLHLWYDAGGGNVVRAVDGVSFTLEERGEAIGIVGESGSGKTSLALALMRMLPKNVARFDGSIRLDGQELTSLPDDQFRREIRWQQHRHGLPGRHERAQPRPPNRRADRRAPAPRQAIRQDCRSRPRRELLERVGLPADFASRYPHELSGGQRQRVGIATALVLDPDLLILDEPTSALDVSVQAQIMNLLKDLKEDPGISMLFITHDIGLASDLCDRIAVAYAGEQMEFGPADRVLVTPHHPYSQLLLASCPACIQTSHPARCPATRPISPRSRRDAAFTPAVPTSSRRVSTTLPRFHCPMADMRAAG